MNHPDIEIHIDELVLHGFDPAQRHLVADHLAAALGPALAEHGIGAWATQAGAIDHLATPPIAISQPITPHDAGRIGQGIAETLR
jgi:hypothetical protein